MTSVELELRDEVGFVWFDRSAGPNLLDRAALEAMPRVLQRLENDSRLRAVVIASRNPAGFIAGADIALFDELGDREAAMRLIGEAQEMFERLSRLPKPTVAAIGGPCAGGGLELALACDYRLASTAPDTHLSLPEVQLGLLPALGGTQRLPRVVGLQAGLDLLLTGRKVYAEPARRMGLVDATIHPEGLAGASLAAAKRLIGRTAKTGRRGSSGMGRLLERTPAKELIFRQAGEQVRKQTRGNYPAPERILEVVRRTYGGSVPLGLQVEAEAFADLLFTPQSQALRHLFFVRSSTRRNPNGSEALALERVGVLGAGLMGAGIAQVSATAGYRVTLKDRSLELAARGKSAIYRGLNERLGKGLTPFQRDATLEHLTITDDYRPFASVDLTIEAVLEELELKRQVLRELEAVTPNDHIFASNTSSLPITAIAEGSARPERVVGMHYFSPVPKMPLLEVVRGRQSSDEAVATAIEVGLKQGKNVIVVADSPGFYVNRILAPYLNEALLAVREGARIEEVDSVMEAAGFPVGPFRLLDNVGLEVAGKAVAVMAPLFSERGVQLDDFVPRVREEGLAGRSNGRGFYLYDKSGKRRVNERIYSMLGVWERREVQAEELRERLLLLLVNEAVHCLDEGIIESRDDGDAGAVFGIGFPPFLGGPFLYLDRAGSERVRSKLQEFEARFGSRFSPAAGLAG